MSELTRCNKCNLEAIWRTVPEGHVLTVKPAPWEGFTTGVHIFTHPPETPDSELKMESPHWRAWFAELPDSCAC